MSNIERLNPRQRKEQRDLERQQHRDSRMTPTIPEALPGIQPGRPIRPMIPPISPLLIEKSEILSELAQLDKSMPRGTEDLFTWLKGKYPEELPTGMPEQFLTKISRKQELRLRLVDVNTLIETEKTPAP